VVTLFEWEGEGKGCGCTTKLLGWAEKLLPGEARGTPTQASIEQHRKEAWLHRDARDGRSEGEAFGADLIATCVHVDAHSVRCACLQ